LVVTVETCEGCGFDAAEYTRDDLLGTLRALAPMWRTMTEGIDAQMLAARPAPEVWSAVEYAAHSRDVTAAMGMLLDLALTEDHPAVEPPPGDFEHVVPEGGLGAAVTELDKQAARLMTKATKAADDGWTRRVDVGDATVDVAWIVGHAVHDATHHVRDVGRGLHALGAGATSQKGSLVQISSSDGGVPKSALPSATVGRRGVLGDRQAERKHHGRPLQALSIWSQEVIDALRGEGHPIGPGLAGENLTVSGIDWRTIRPGVRIAIGEVLAEISAFATPCVKNAQWFSDRDFRRIDHSLHPGWSRAYAWVLEGGVIAPGDDVLVEP
jgi:hypothetical protein